MRQTGSRERLVNFGRLADILDGKLAPTDVAVIFRNDVDNVDRIFRQRKRPGK